MAHKADGSKCYTLCLVATIAIDSMAILEEYRRCIGNMNYKGGALRVFPILTRSSATIITMWGLDAAMTAPVKVWKESTSSTLLNKRKPDSIRYIFFHHS